MSDAKKVIQMVFAGVDELSPKIAAITKEFDKSQASIDKFAAPIAGVTEKLLAFEAAVGGAGAALATYAVSEAVKFQDAQTALAQVLGDTTRTVESFGDSALDLSNKFGTAATAVSASFAEFSSAGFAADEVEVLTASVLKFATASSLDAATSTEALVRILKGFNLEAKETPGILDVVTRSSDVYATNVDQITEALARSAPIAKASNLSIAETTGVLTPMIEVFKSAEMASTAFNAVMQRLVGDNANVAEGLDKLKVSQLDSTGALRSGKDILLDVQKAYQNLDPSQKLVTTNLLAGAEHAAKFTYVFDNLEKTATVTAVSLAGVGTAVDERLQKKMHDTSFAMGLVATQLKNAAIIAGGEFLKGINSAGSGLSTLALTLQDLAKSEGFKTFAAAVTAQLARAGEAVEKFAKALPAALEKIDLTAFQEQLTLLGLSFEGLFDGIDLTSPEGLAKALQKIIDLGTQFLAFNRGVIDGLGPVLTIFGETLTLVSQLDPEILKLIGTLGGLSIGWTLLSPAISGASSTLKGFGQLIGVGGDLLKGIGAASAATTILGGSMLATAGYIGVAAAAGYAVGTGFNFLIDKLTQSTTQFDSVGEAMYFLVHGAAPALMTSTEALAASTAALAAEQGTSTEALAGAGTQWGVLSGQLDVGLLKLGEVGKAVIEQKSAVSQLHPEYARLSEELQEAIKWEQLTADACGPLTEEMYLAGTNVLRLKNTVDLAKDGFVDIGGVWTQVTAVGQELATATDTVGEKAEKAAEKAAKLALESAKLELEWAKLEAHTRELVFTASVDLQIENVKAQADEFKSIMESLNTSIESTGETLLGLANLFDKSQRTLGGQEILQLLRAEEERRKQSFLLQKQMTEAQLKYLAASTKRLESGDALITIQADGIEPELKSVLFKIIDLAHIEAAGEAGPLLLGLPNL